MTTPSDDQIAELKAKIIEKFVDGARSFVEANFEVLECELAGKVFDALPSSERLDALSDSMRKSSAKRDGLYSQLYHGMGPLDKSDPHNFLSKGPELAEFRKLYTQRKKAELEEFSAEPHEAEQPTKKQKCTN